MEIVNVIVTAVAGFALGAVWYNVFGTAWMEAAEIERDADGKPKGGMDPKVMALTFVMQLLVAGMMRHIFALGGIDTLGEGIVSGFGIGLFFISPWTVINNANAGRPFRLSMIDGGYATLACSVMGLVLTLF
ncbi:MAG: DUF1761 domain-containing protein [Rhodobacteraceae bacterium]|nr:MAG: DUF1761 domain-containing protein [Paracoccaceae bacterium]